MKLSMAVTGAVCGLLLSHSNTAQAEGSFYSGLQSFTDLMVPDVKQISIGLGPSFGPDYLGSDDYEFRPKASFYIRFNKFLTLENDGASFNVLGLSNFQFGPVLHLTDQRKQSANPALNGLGNIQGSLDFGLYTKFLIADKFSARLRYFNDFLSNDNGGLFELSLNTVLYKREHLSVVLGVTGSWADKKRAQQFFGITAAQSATSGLAEYRPGGSFQDARVDLGARWDFAKNWSLNGYARYSRLVDNIANSPIVDPLGSANQFTVGSFVSYTFEFND